MSRSKQSIAEDLMEITSMLPWWACLLLSISLYIVLSFNLSYGQTSTIGKTKINPNLENLTRQYLSNASKNLPQEHINNRRYYISINKEIIKVWHYPANVNWDKDLEATVEIKINKNGQVTKVELVKKSRDEFFNNYILKILKK